MIPEGERPPQCCAKPDLKSLPLNELTQRLSEAGFPAFRARQVYRWVHVQLVRDVDEMSNLPKDLKTYLKDRYRLTALKTAAHQISRIDGTQKFLFELPDGETIESVYMKYHYGSSVCISSQAGCRMGCRFCASAIGGLARNLLPGEMLEEVYAIQRSLLGVPSSPDASAHADFLLMGDKPSGISPQSSPIPSVRQDNVSATADVCPDKAPAGEKAPSERISHVVIMGTGEPLDNYDNVVQFIRMLTDADGLHLSARNITLSTCGIVPRIYDLAKEGLPVTLALSLHAVTDEQRRGIMPVANRYTIRECIDACQFYAQATGRRVTFEYSLIRGVNDSEEDAARLAALAESVGGGDAPGGCGRQDHGGSFVRSCPSNAVKNGKPEGHGRQDHEGNGARAGKAAHRKTAPAAHINLIPVNPVTESGYERPDTAAVRAFQTKLEKHGIHVSIRRALGRDIDGACGQLRHRHAGNGE